MHASLVCPRCHDIFPKRNSKSNPRKTASGLTRICPGCGLIREDLRAVLDDVAAGAISSRQYVHTVIYRESDPVPVPVHPGEGGMGANV